MLFERLTAPCDLAEFLGSLQLIQPLLDAMADQTFFVKDAAARYLLANRTLAQRCGLADSTALRGRTAEEVFPAPLGAQYTAQDREVLQGRRLSDKLELHLYPGREPGWCMTHKLPLYDRAGRIIGMAGVSLDLQAAQSSHPAYHRLAAVDAHIREHFSRPIALTELTALAGLSTAQLERLCKRIYGLTPRQLIHKARLEEASRLLLQDHPITEIAHRCGYADHSAFSRQFKSLTGLSPSDYRQAHQNGQPVTKGNFACSAL
ncbi:AraC family transcriptional regulator [Stutzerimonas azotifigens]|uniref:AraC family transcriptional regulator n=1 Tax=Stutzerimonas azotifigens TaxID=291995 RepID=UPI000684315C|nr:AraC family transcriptional regulator [Stutzerimonas azotifigens]